jgi:hypothetical protein
MLERDYQKKLKEKLYKRFPDAIIFKTDPFAMQMQGFPDLLILKNDKWAALEVKAAEKSSHQPNQEDYINRIKHMGNYAAFIFPENEKEILNELERALNS